MASNGKGVPQLKDIDTIRALGYSMPGDPKDDIKKFLRINDEQCHLQRFVWRNLPNGITGNLLERILYYKGSGALLWLEGAEEFVFLPFTYKGQLDYYGRYGKLTPLAFNGSSETTTKDNKTPADIVLSSVTADIVWYPIQTEELYDTVIVKKNDILVKSAVVLDDYTKQLPQKIIPKYELTERVIDMEAEILPYVDTALGNSTGIAGMRVGGGDEYKNAELASKQVKYAALNGMKWVPIKGDVQLQELTGGQVAKAEEFLLTMQSLENVRLGIHGLPNHGVFEKKSHTTDLENSINVGNSNYVLQDALWNRQKFCAIANTLWGLNIQVFPSETAVGSDYNMDGVIGETQNEMMVDGTQSTQEVATDGNNG